MITDFKCPNCEQSYYTVGPSYVTAMYFEPIYKDGVNINPDRNTYTTEVTCLGCGKVYTVSQQYGTPDTVVEKKVKSYTFTANCPNLTVTEPSMTMVHTNQDGNIETETRNIWEDVSSG